MIRRPPSSTLFPYPPLFRSAQRLRRRRAVVSLRIRRRAHRLHRSLHRVKALHLNLASRPYRDYKPVYAVVVITSLAIAFLMLNNVETYYRYVNETQSTRALIAKRDSEAAEEHRRAAAADAQLHRVDLTSLDIETKVINARLPQRALSWSELLDRLEHRMPDHGRNPHNTPSVSK